MNRNLLYILISILLLGNNSLIWAHPFSDIDTTMVKNDTVPEKKKVPTEKKIHENEIQIEQHFNAINYSLQKRHMTKKCQFPHSKNFWDNTYYGLGAGVEDFVDRKGATMEMNSSVEVFAAKEINANHAVRLSLYAGYANSTASTDNFQRFGLRANYLFNPTAYIAGYNPYRIFEALFVTGLGVGTTGYQQHNNVYGEFNLGFLFKLHLQKQLDFFLEPKVSFYTDGVDVHSQGNWHKYDLGYGATIGLTYHLKDPMRATTGKYARKEKDFYDGFSIGLAVGGQFQLTDKTKEMGIFSTCLPDVQLSINKWISNPFGLRLSPFFGTHLWSEYNANTDSESDVVMNQNLQAYYYGARFEGMFDIAQIIKPVEDRHRFTMLVIGGLEFGGISKQDRYTKLKDLYIGFSASLQFKYRIAKGYSVFLEPAYSFIPYTYLPEHYDGSYLERMRFYDHVFRLNLGVEYDFGKLIGRKK